MLNIGKKIFFGDFCELGNWRKKKKTETGEFTEMRNPENDCHVTRTTRNLQTNLISSSRRFSSVFLNATTKRGKSELCGSDSIGIMSKQYT